MTTQQMFPDDPITPDLEDQPLNIGLYGPVGIGKTTLARDMGNGRTVFCVTQDTHRHLASRPAYCEDWKDVLLTRDQFLNGSKEKNPILCVDTIDRACKMLQQDIAHRHGVKDIGDIGDMAKGWRLYSQELTAFLESITDEGRGLITISHAEYQKILDPNQSYHTTQPTISHNKSSLVVEQHHDIVAFMTYPLLRKKDVEKPSKGQKSTTFLKFVGQDISRLIQNAEEDLQQAEAHQRLLILQGTKYWTAKSRSDLCQFPRILLLPFPEDENKRPQNTAEPFLNVYQEVMEESRRRAEVLFKSPKKTKAKSNKRNTKTKTARKGK